MAKAKRPLPRDGIYLVILRIMVATVLAGALLALLGERVWHDEAISAFGTYVALLAAAIYVFFRVLGQREANRRAEEEGEDEA
jgi:threonine/homoserine efflux transporter RhtA